MSMNHNGKESIAPLSLVGELVSSSAYDEVFLHCTDGYCVFDENQKLQAFSSDFPSLYPSIKNQIIIGMSYAEYMRVFAENAAIQNMGDIESIDKWVEHALTLLDKQTTRHTHHLIDGRWMLIKTSRTSTGHWLFVANDITELRVSQLALKESNVRYRTFAHMTMDWFWELDADLNYVYLSCHTPEFVDEPAIGSARLDFINGSAVHNAEREEHNAALLERREVDVVLEWKNEEVGSRHIQVVAKPEFDKNGQFTGYLGCGLEVTEDVALKSKLNHLAEHDDLTGLINRRAFEIKLKNQLNSQSQKESLATLCFMDLDQFKLVNDGGGHEAGDSLLAQIASTLVATLGENTVVARLGGDEFALILDKEVNESLRAVNDLISLISSTPFVWNQRNYSIGASAGLVSIDKSSNDISELMSHADTACYIAKNAGRNQAQIYMYDEYFQDPVSLELKQVNLLRDAMDNDGLLIYLQQIKAIQKDRTHMHFEVLLRYRAPDGTIRSAGEFISVAEKYDLVQHLDKWVLREALIVLRQVEDNNLDVSLSINLSGNSLNNNDSYAKYSAMITKSGVNPKLITFEVTETAAIKSIAVAKQFISQMKAFGCGFALDDFGSGLSSFGYLKELQADYLKIDGSFVKDMTNDSTCRAIVSAFNQLSHELGMETVAEFVQDDETEELLKLLGVDFVQGYGVGKPQAATQWLEYLLEHRRSA